jgi:hypothetical protein
MTKRAGKQMATDAWMLLSDKELGALSKAIGWVLNDYDICERKTFTTSERQALLRIYRRIAGGRFERKDKP